MDRQIVFPGSIPLDTDVLGIQRNAMVALGYLAQMVLGTDTVVDGLACAPTVPASMQVSVGPGSLTQFGVVDAAAFGSLPAGGQPLVRMGINTEPVLFPLFAPDTPGQQLIYLVQAQFAEQDASPVVLPYYNAANPAQPYSGPGNSGAAQNTRRLQRVALDMKMGIAGLPGNSGVPDPDPGWVGLYSVTTHAGAGSIGAGDIAVLPRAPFCPFKLPQLAPGFSRQAVYSSSATWVAPAGVHRVKVRLAGGGGGGGGSTGSGAGGGGGAGGYAEASLDVVPGQAYYLSVGAGGTSGGSGQAGGNGQATWFAGLVGATGGLGGAASPDGQGGFRGVGQFGGSGVGVFVQYGGAGADGVQGGPAGSGGASFFGGGGRGLSGGGEAANGDAWGSGGGGSSGEGVGGLGANGGIIVEY